MLLRHWGCFIVLLGWCVGTGCALITLGFDFHHRFSDPVKEFLAVDDLPVRGSVAYFNAMVHRDLDRLGQANGQAPVTFAAGNDTHRLNALGYLHYANVSVGSPPLSFLVALDTGSDLFWLPCDCYSCVTGLRTPRGKVEFNIYSPRTSMTSSKVLCNSSICGQHRHCYSAQSGCPYQVMYLSNDTSSSGFLVDDVLHLITEDAHPKAVEANVTFGCGQVQTGSFLSGAAPNGLLGLGMNNFSVPSILAREKVARNSFSMCFAPNGHGRINFGDTGSADQGQTTFNLKQLRPSYNVSITEINVGGNSGKLNFTAIFDSGTSFTYLTNPAYAEISESFNKLASDKRHALTSDLPFKFCYEISSKKGNLKYPRVNLTMKGGDQFSVNSPVVLAPDEGDVYCLGIIKSDDVNIIGQNFMTGYRIVFDRERMVLGWKASNCNDIEMTNTVPVKRPPPPAGKTNNNAHISGAPSSLMITLPMAGLFLILYTM